MKDPAIETIVNLVQTLVDEINEATSILHKKDVEIKVVFNDAKGDTPPHLYIWKAIEHIDYVKSPK